MYNLIKLQKHDAFYQSREGGKCSIKCFNADLQCHTTKAVENISHSLKTVFAYRSFKGKRTTIYLRDISYVKFVGLIYVHTL